MQKIIIFALIYLMGLQAFGQTKTESKYAFVINVGQQTLGINYDVGALQTIQKTPFKPRLEAGIERTWKQKKNFRLHQDLKLTYVNDPYQEQVFGLGTDLGFEFKILKRILLTPRLGVHYNRATPTDVHYIYENDKWIQTTNSYEKNNRIFVKAGFDLGFKVNQKFDLFVYNQLSLNLPHIKEVIPLNVNKAIGLGIRWRY
jgi:hypothetical protein